SESVAVYGGADDRLLAAGTSSGQPILPRARIQPDTRHEFVVSHREPVAAIRLDAFPDGGLSRVLAIGSIDQAARRLAGYRWFNALPAGQATAALVDGGMSADNAAEVVSRRPLTERRSEHPGPEHGTLLAILDGRHPPGRRGLESATAQP
ncbi:MAG: hypothetical protein ACTHJW_20450, partial [Streptosporangiaceae bacterium]